MGTPVISGVKTTSIINEKYVTKSQLQNIYTQTLVTNEMITELNNQLEKYKITNKENIQHFIAQTCIETGYGASIVEKGSDSHLSKKKYGKKYSGVGYIQMTWDYGYCAFATYLILEYEPNLKKICSFKNPRNNNSEVIFKEYKKITNISNENKYNISKYTDIVNIGRDYVEKNFAWETATYFWTINKLTSANKLTSVDDVTRIVNKWTDSYKERRDAYNLVIKHIK